MVNQISNNIKQYQHTSNIKELAPLKIAKIEFCCLSLITLLIKYSEETENISILDENAPLPQWAVKTDADIVELKKQKTVTYEMYVWGVTRQII